jgi:lipopolysaccharide biosynthesis glycosyltransferase
MTNETKSFTKVISIALAADNSYTIYMAITILSILINAKSKTFYNFYLLVTSDFTKENMSKITILQNKFSNCTMTFINMKGAFSNRKLGANRLTSPTYYKLYFSEIFPDIDKIIWFDDDIIVKIDLHKMYDSEISNYYLTGVKHASYAL